MKCFEFSQRLYRSSLASFFIFFAHMGLSSSSPCCLGRDAREMMLSRGATSNLEDAKQMFWHAGYVVILDAFSDDYCNKCLETCEGLGRTLRAMPDACRNGGSHRYSMVPQVCSNEFALAEMLCQSGCCSNDLLQHIVGEDFSVIKLGGDFVDGCNPEDQECHSDWSAAKPFSAQEAEYKDMHLHGWAPPCVCLSATVHDILPGQGALRIWSWTDMDEWGSFTHPPTLRQEELGKINAATSLALPKGCAIIRDVRVFHAGSANMTSNVRWLPGMLAAPSFVMHEENNYRPGPFMDDNVFQQVQDERPDMAHHFDYLWTDAQPPCV